MLKKRYRLTNWLIAATLVTGTGAAGLFAQHVALGAEYGPWGFDIAGVDRKAEPGDSFYDFANGIWDARSPIPGDKARSGVFDALRDSVQEQVRAIIEEAARSGAAPDTDAGKIGALYSAFMDEARVEQLDAAPLAG